MQVVFPKVIFPVGSTGAFRREVADSNFHSMGARCHQKNAEFLEIIGPGTGDISRGKRAGRTTDSFLPSETAPHKAMSSGIQGILPTPGMNKFPKIFFTLLMAAWIPFFAAPGTDKDTISEARSLLLDIHPNLEAIAATFPAANWVSKMERTEDLSNPDRAWVCMAFEKNVAWEDIPPGPDGSVTADTRKKVLKPDFVNCAFFLGSGPLRTECTRAFRASKQGRTISVGYIFEMDNSETKLEEAFNMTFSKLKAAFLAAGFQEVGHEPTL